MKKNRSVLNSPRLTQLRNRKKRNFRNKVIFTLLGITVIVGGLVYFSRIPDFNIQSVETNGNQVIATADIQKIAEADMAGTYLWLFPKTNFLLYPRHKIEIDLANTFKRATDINTDLRGTTTLNISLTERTAAYTWCGATPPSDNCYFIDNTGYIFDQAPYFSGTVYFQFYGSTDGDPNTPLGTYFMQGNLSKLVNLKNEIEEMGLTLSSLYVEDDGDAEFFLSSTIAPPDGPAIVFTTTDDYDTIVENLETALTTDPLESDLKKNPASLQYIDLRYGNKVYYKFNQ